VSVMGGGVMSGWGNGEGIRWRGEGVARVDINYTC
jgi:hypothetical protein